MIEVTKVEGENRTAVTQALGQNYLNLDRRIRGVSSSSALQRHIQDSDSSCSRDKPNSLIASALNSVHKLLKYNHQLTQ